MANNKTIIHEFDPCIYPRMLWVVKGGTLEEIRKTLEFGELDEDSKNGGAITLSAYDNAQRRGGFLVWFPHGKDMSHGDWMAHEAAHVALGIFDHIGSNVSCEDSEPFAYLVGWAFECMDMVRKFKEGKNYGTTKGESKDNEAVFVEETCEEKKGRWGR